MHTYIPTYIHAYTELLAKEDVVAESSLPPLLQEIMTPLNILLVCVYVYVCVCVCVCSICIYTYSCVCVCVW
jgi:hypothetical protein